MGATTMSTHLNRSHILGCLTGLACFLLAARVESEHVPSLAWMARYSSASGTYCCSERDCISAVVALAPVGRETGKTVVLVNAVLMELPTQSVHPSEDGNTYWCCKTDDDGKCPPEPTPGTTRCVFYTGGV